MGRDPYVALMRARLWRRIHIAFTIWLCLALVAVGGLAAAGWLHLGPQAEPRDETANVPGQKENDPGGRYQIEPVEETRQVLNRLGRLGFLGPPVQETWVFRYTGGYLECRLETDQEGRDAVHGATVPEDWTAIVRQNEWLGKGRGDAFVRQGYIIVAALQPVLPVEAGLVPYHPSLGGLFVAGPAGPLHPLANLHLASWQPRRFRLLVTIDPPSGGLGGKLHRSAEQEFFLLLPFVSRGPDEEEKHISGGRKLTAGRRMTILDRQTGHSRVRLDARFLSDSEVRTLIGR